MYGTEVGACPSSPPVFSAEATNLPLPPIAVAALPVKGTNAPVLARYGAQVLPMFRTSGPEPEETALLMLFCRSFQLMTSRLTLMPVVLVKCARIGVRIFTSSEVGPPDWLLAQYVMVDPEAPFELLLLPLVLQPVATSARETAPTIAADSLVRRENFTVTPLCAWMGRPLEASHLRALSRDRPNSM